MWNFDGTQNDMSGNTMQEISCQKYVDVCCKDWKS